MSFLTRDNINSPQIQDNPHDKGLIEKELIRYLRLAKYITLKNTNESISQDKLLSKTFAILPVSIKNKFENLTDNAEFRAVINENPIDTKAYHTFCFNILNCLTAKLDIEICEVNEKYFDCTFLSSKGNNHSNLVKDKQITENCAFIIKNTSTNLIFSFGHQDRDILQNLSNYIYKMDNNNYKNIHIIIFKNSEELNDARKLSKSKIYKRCFFTSFDNICRKAIEIDKEFYEKVFSIKWEYVKSRHNPKNMASLHDIIIEDNIPVGKADSKLYKLTFKTEDAIDICPGQFIMINTLREQKERSKTYKPNVVKSISDIKPDIQNDLITKQISYLKRPFGIYRAYYENFSDDYLSKLSIEQSLAAILFTVKPNKFEIIYKVLDGGVGTNELTKVVKGDNIQILAPLGKIFDVRELLKEDFDEIHIIGGGVGIAPLAYIVQTLRYLNIKVKAFIGVEDYNSLIYKNIKGRNAKIYVDDLKLLGLSGSDIYVSFLCDTREKRKIDIQNAFTGNLVTEPFSEYLKKHNNLKILTFTCGPIPMMQKVHDITSQYNIKSYVLMEKRMACGIGVCFSCVCKTSVNGEDHYSRVCIDGPIIESKQIKWNE